MAVKGSKGQRSLGEVVQLPSPAPGVGHGGFPPRFIDFTALSDAEMRRTIDELIEYAQVEPFTIRAVVDARFGRECIRRSLGNVRPTDSEEILKYRRDMDAGCWEETLDPWRFDERGAYVDAHHRAEALSGAKAPLKISIGFGVPSKAVPKIDRGRTRRQSAVLGEDSKRVSAVRSAMTIQRGGRKGKYSDSEVQLALLRYASAFAVLPAPNRYPAAVWGVLLSLFPVYPEQIKTFAEQLLASEVDPVHSSVRLLRARLRKKDDARSRMTPWTEALSTMLAVRAFILGRPITKLQIKDGEEMNSNNDGGVWGWFKSRAGV